MKKNRTYHKKKTVIIFSVFALMLLGLMGRMFYLMVIRSDYYSRKAQELHERERDIKAARGRILDCNGEVLADNKAVCTISVIHSQITEPEKVIGMLVKELGISEETARDRIRSYELSGVKVDEDYKRNYPYSELASKVLGFTGGDNQGIVGLEVMYEEVLKGIDGKILTTTDARGVELSELGESRVEPVEGYDLQISLDKNIQMYAQQAALKVMEEKEAQGVSILLMNPQNGEIYANVNVPEYDLNDPFTLNTDADISQMTDQEFQDACNQMWRNPTINDTYEPGSTFKIITMAAGLSQGVVDLDDQFNCPGYKIVEDRRIHCHKRTGHGAENFVEGAMNSCNPVFIEVGLRLGAETYYNYFQKFGLMEKTGIDLPGEAGTIMHKKEDIGQVELATISFGQSFQITPIQLATTVSSIINGGKRVTPHFGVQVTDSKGNLVEKLEYKTQENVVSSQVSEEVRYILEKVVSEGSGKNAAIEGRTVGGKTATSQTLPRSENRYISSFLGFTPAEDPKILGIVVIYDPQGVYYGGTIAAPVLKDIYENILPYMGIEG